MDTTGVLIEYNYQNDTYSGSGMLFEGHWIICTGSLLSPLLKNIYSRNSKNQIFEQQTDRIQRIENNTDISPIKCSVFLEKNNTLTFENKTVFLDYDEIIGHVYAYWKCKNISKVLNAELSDWIINYENEESKFIRAILPLVFILEIQTTNFHKERSLEKSILNLYTLCQKVNLTRGDLVTLQSTPFGSKAFLNAYSQGIVSNLIGDKNCLILTDASASPGCEGGPIYILVKRDKNTTAGQIPVGLILASMSWWRDEWVGFTLGISLSPLLEQIVVNSDSSSRSITHIEKYDTSNIGDIDSSIIQVTCGTGWGTGIVVNKEKSLIITNSHVVKNHKRFKIWGLWKGSRFPLKVLYRTIDGKPYDVAVLQNTTHELGQLNAIKFSSTLPRYGEPVIAIGYPFFRENVHSAPTVTSGSISHTSSAMLHTTCSVQSGASGGAIVRKTTGELLGIMVCNIASNSTHTAFPHLNMAVPSYIIQNALTKYISSGDVAALEDLKSRDPDVIKCWTYLSAKL